MRIEKNEAKAPAKAPAKVIKVQKEFRIPGTKIIVEEGDELEIYPAEVGYDAGADLEVPGQDDLDDSPFGEAEEGDHKEPDGDEDGKDTDGDGDGKKGEARKPSPKR